MKKLINSADKNIKKKNVPLGTKYLGIDESVKEFLIKKRIWNQSEY